MLNRPHLSTVELLEGRRLLSAAIVEGVLNVDGTADADEIIVSLNTTDPAATKLDVKLNGEVSSFPLADVTSLKISGGGGADVITIDETAGTITLAAQILGGNGKDILTGGSGNDSLDGGNGKDVLTSGAGDDTLVGGRGKDKLDGGAGTNVLEQEKQKKARKDKDDDSDDDAGDDNPGAEHRLHGHVLAKGKGHDHHTRHH
jgi:Ca2+-binding RTX toxin-like protein